MPAAGGEYSLKTQILMDFEQAKEEAKSFSTVIGTTATSMEKLSKSVGFMNLNVSELLKAELSKWSGGQSAEVITFSKGLKDKLEASIAQAIASKNITFKWEDGAPMSVALNSTHKKALVEGLREGLVKNLKFTDLNMPIIKLSREQKGLIEQKFNDYLTKAVSKRLIFTGEDGEVANAAKTKLKFTVDMTHMQALVNRVQQEFEKILASSDLIEFENLKPVKLDSKQLALALDRVRSKLGNIDEHLNIDFDKLGELPDINASLAKFKQNIQRVATELMSVVKSIESTDLSASAGDMKKVSATIDSLRIIVAERISNLVDDVAKKLVSMPDGKLDLVGYQDSIETVALYVDKYVISTLRGATAAMVESMGLVGSKGADGQVYSASIRKLREIILKAAKEAVSKVLETDLHMDMTPVQQAFNIWSKEMAKNMALTTEAALANVYNAITANYKDSMLLMVNQIKNSVQFKVDMTTDNQPIPLVIPMEEIRATFLPKLQAAVTAMIMKTVPVMEGTGLEVDATAVVQAFSKSFQGVIQTLVMANSAMQTAQSEVLVTLESAIASEDHIKPLPVDFTAILRTALAKVELAALDSVNKWTPNIADGSETVHQAPVDYTNSVLSALARIELSVLASIKAWTPKAFPLELPEIKFTKKQTKLLTDPVREAISTMFATTGAKMQSELLQAVANANMGVLVKPKYMKMITQPIQSAVNSLFTAAGATINAEIQSMLTGVHLSTPINMVDAMTTLNMGLNQFINKYMDRVASVMFTDVSTGGFAVKTRDLHPAVKKSLADQAGMSVKEYTKANPILSSTADVDMLSKIMQENLKAVLAKFHRSLQSNTTIAIKEYTTALNEVKIDPNIEAVHDLTRRMTNLQEAIVKKIKEILKVQFTTMLDEIKAMQAVPISIGYQPTRSLSQGLARVAAASGGASGSSATTTTRAAVSAPQAPVVSPVYDAGYAAHNNGMSTTNFMGSVMNTMRYITAGAVMGIPMTAAYTAWEATKSFDYSLEKANQNFLSKDRNMTELATDRVDIRHEQAATLGDYGVSDAQYNNPIEKQKLVQIEATRLINMSKSGAINPLQSMAANYGIGMGEVGQAWQISSRRLGDPYEALAMTRSAAKIYATDREEITAEESAMGLEAVSSQWGLNGYELDKYANMIIKTSMLSQATPKDILDAQGKSGAIFRQVMPDETKEKAFATSAAMQSMFVQATALSGKEAGNFWKSILTSPNQKNVAEYLTQQSRTPGLERLNPFIEERLPDGVIKTKPKSGYEQFMNIVDVSNDLKSAGREKERMVLLTQVFKRFQIGGEQAIQAMITDMDRLSKSKDASGARSTDELIKKIMEVTQEDIDAVIGGLSNTWKFKQQKLSSTWQSSTFGVIEAFKPTASRGMDDLTAIMTVIKDNAQTFADALRLAATVAIGYAIKTGASKQYRAGNSWLMEHEFASNAIPLQNRRRQMYMDRRVLAASLGRDTEAAVNGAGGLTDQAKLEDKLGRKTAAHSTLGQKITDSKAELVQMQSVGDPTIIATREAELLTWKAAAALDPKHQAEVDQREIELTRLKAPAATPAELAKKQGYITGLENSHTKLGAGIQTDQTKLGGMKAAGATAEASLAATTAQILAMDTEMGELESQTTRLKAAFGELGANSDQMNARLSKADTEFKRTIRSSDVLAAELGTVGSSAGQAASNITQVTADMIALNEQFDSGVIGANEYARSMHRLNSNSPTYQAPLATNGTMSSGGLMAAGAGILKGLKGVGIAAAIAAALEVVTGLVTDSALSPGIRAQHRVSKEEETYLKMEMFKKDSVANNVPGIAIGGAALVTQWITGGIGKMLGGDQSTDISFAQFMKLFKGVADGKSVDGALQTTSELKAANALAAKEERIKQEKDDAKYLHLSGGKHADTTKTGWAEVRSLEDAQTMNTRVEQQLGYETAKIDLDFIQGKTKALLAGERADSDTIRELTAKMLQDTIAAETKAMEAQQNFMKNIEATDKSYKTNPAWLEANKVMEERQKVIAEGETSKKENKDARAQAVLALAAQNLGYRNSSVDLTFTRNKNAALAAGSRRDSDTIRDLTVKMLKDMIAALKVAISEQQTYLKTIQGDPASKQQYNDMLKDTQDKEKQVSDMEMQIKDTKDTKVQEIEGRTQRDKSVADSKTRIKLDDAILRGFGEDSLYYKQLERDSYTQQNGTISSTIAELQAQAANMTGDSKDDTLVKIAELQAESRDNLVKIYKTLNSNATFNIPSGIKPTTYFQYLGKNSNEQSMAVSKGDINITVKFDTVYAGSQAEINEKIVAPITKSISEQLNASRNAASALSQQAARGISNFRGR